MKHNPAVYYDGVVADRRRVGRDETASALCTDNVVPTGRPVPNDTSALDAALASGDVAGSTTSFRTCVRTHTTSVPGDQGRRSTNSTTSSHVRSRRVLASPAFGDDGVLIVTFDEGASTTGGFPSNTSTPCKAWDACPHPFDGGGNIAFLVISPLADPGLYHERANLYSMLRTLEDGLGITNYLGAADSARAIDEIWGRASPPARSGSFCSWSGASGPLPPLRWEPRESGGTWQTRWT